MEKTRRTFGRLRRYYDHSTHWPGRRVRITPENEKGTAAFISAGAVSRKVRSASFPIRKTKKLLRFGRLLHGTGLSGMRQKFPDPDPLSFSPTTTVYGVVSDLFGFGRRVRQGRGRPRRRDLAYAHEHKGDMADFMDSVTKHHGSRRHTRLPGLRRRTLKRRCPQCAVCRTLHLRNNSAAGGRITGCPQSRPAGGAGKNPIGEDALREIVSRLAF